MDFIKEAFGKLLNRMVHVTVIQLVFMGVAIYFGSKFWFQMKGEYNKVDAAVENEPQTVSNAVIQAVAPVSQQVNQLEKQQNKLAKQVNGIEAASQDNSRKIDKLTGYVEGHDGQIINYRDPLTNGGDSVTVTALKPVNADP